MSVILDRDPYPTYKYQICLDEVGRGCLFGDAYIACVILPKEPTPFDGTNIKDSKKFSSKKKLKQVAEYIKENALYYHVCPINAADIDKLNILKAVMKGMHICITSVFEEINKKESITYNDCIAVVDGNYFTPYVKYDEQTDTFDEMPHVTIEKGDGKIMGIAAASILAKDARDSYISELCDTYPILDERYNLRKNVGYATTAHREGIQSHGICQWHRKTFGICKESTSYVIETNTTNEDEDEDTDVCETCQETVDMDYMTLCERCDKSQCDDCGGDGGDWGENEVWVCNECLPQCLECENTLRCAGDECCGKGRTDK